MRWGRRWLQIGLLPVHRPEEGNDVSHHTSTIDHERAGDQREGGVRADGDHASAARSASGRQLTELVAATRSGCPAAEAALYDHHRRMVTAVARRHGLDDHQSADVVQRAWLKARQGLSNLRRDDRFGPWLAAIARNESISLIRSTSREVSFGDQDLADDHRSDPDRQVILAEQHGLLRAAVALLDSKDRELVRLLFEEDLAYQQVAAALGKPMGSIGPTRGRVLRRLRHLIEGEDLVPVLAA